MDKINVQPAEGKLGILCVGLGAVTSTFMVGTLMARKGLAQPIGSLSQLAKIRVGRGESKQYKKINEIVPLASLDDIVFGAWDIFEDNAYESAMHAEVLKEKDINPVKDELVNIKPMKAVFDHNFVKRLNGTNIKEGKSRWDLMEQVREDIRSFKEENNCNRIVVIWAASTEIYVPMTEEHMSVQALEKAMKEDKKEVVPPSICYAYASILEGCPFIMGAPNLCVDIPAMWELSKQHNIPIAGKDFKTGQTMMKTVLAPALKTRMLGLSGWFSTNILGNRDGEVLDDPDNFKTKEVSKLSVIETILDGEEYPELYKDIYHKVRINYYPPRNDDKEGWDNLDIFGWMGYHMQIKVDFLCKDSILAAPLLLDLVLFSDLAKRAGMSGIQTWLSFYLKSPMHDFEHKPIHDLSEQFAMLKNQIRLLGGYEADQEID